ncbi:uncharacterized protein LOC111633481 [Centruroides sculpturatus]|uniref:uncharacterized protein LOC111633481 n=1 Tax=Centruroides sculpturatus TaxID=218467 RepID=UPI000C6E2524|nr:uncharacterized protein LOC111633481 [Centruroides sculpturatus]
MTILGTYFRHFGIAIFKNNRTLLYKYSSNPPWIIKFSRKFHKRGSSTAVNTATKFDIAPAITQIVPTTSHSLKIIFKDHQACDFKYVWVSILLILCLVKAPMLTPVHQQRRLKFAHQYSNWTSTEWRQVAFSDESRFVLYQTDGRWHIQREASESKHPTIAARVQAGGGSIMVWGMFSWHSPGALIIVEGLQMLHCLKANDPKENGTGVGGKSFFVDGFYIANWLRDVHPAAFHILSSTPVKFAIKSHSMNYSQTIPVICVDNDGEVQEIHYNNRTMAPLQIPSHLVMPFYHAYQLMANKMREESCQLSFHMVPGDLVAFNNRRVLHGRTSFDPTKVTRHLQGCYVDIDEVFTRYKAMISE